MAAKPPLESARAVELCTTGRRARLRHSSGVGVVRGVAVQWYRFDETTGFFHGARLPPCQVSLEAVVLHIR